MLIQPLALQAREATRPRPATSEPVDRVTLGAAPAQASSMEAARKLFTVDTERSRHVLASFPIDDVRQHGSTYFYPPTPVFTPSGKLIVGTNKGLILAFEGDRELWRRDTGTVSAYNDPTCTRDGRLLFSNRQTPELLCLREDGSESFRVDLPGPLRQDLQVDGQGNTYAMTETTLVALGPEGQERWRRPVPPEGAAVLTTSDDQVVVVTREGITRLDPDGHETFSHAAPLTQMPVFTPDDSMFLTTDRGLEVVRRDGTVVSVDSLPGEIAFMDADARGNVVVVTENAHVASLDSQGNVRRQRSLWAALPSAPAVLADGHILLCTARSEILKLDSELEVVDGYHLPTQRPGERTIGLKTPQVAPNGSLYVTNSGSELLVLNPEKRPSFHLEGFHRTSPGFSPEGGLAVCHWDTAYVLKERSMQEVLSEQGPPSEPPSRIERQGDFLVVGGSMVRVRKPRL